MCRDGAHRPCRQAIRQEHGRRAQRSMLDVSYFGSTLIGQAGVFAGRSFTGGRFPACHRPERHAPPSDRVRRGASPGFSARTLGRTVSIIDASTAQFDATVAGVPDGGAVLVRPDGFVGFRATPANETTWMPLMRIWRPISSRMRPEPLPLRRRRTDTGTSLSGTILLSARTSTRPARTMCGTRRRYRMAAGILWEPREWGLIRRGPWSMNGAAAMT